MTCQQLKIVLLGKFWLLLANLGNCQIQYQDIASVPIPLENCSKPGDTTVEKFKFWVNEYLSSSHAFDSIRYIQVDIDGNNEADIITVEYVHPWPKISFFLATFNGYVKMTEKVGIFYYLSSSDKYFMAKIVFPVCCCIPNKIVTVLEFDKSSNAYSIDEFIISENLLLPLEDNFFSESMKFTSNNVIPIFRMPTYNDELLVDECTGDSVHVNYVGEFGSSKGQVYFELRDWQFVALLTKEVNMEYFRSRQWIVGWRRKSHE